MENEIIDLMIELINKKAVNPRSQDGAFGEMDRAEFLKSRIKKLIPKVKIDEFVAYDKESPHPYRPNLVATLEGIDSSRSLFIITHLDTVPEGDLSLWNTNPYEGVHRDGKIYGRGAEDNLQPMVSSIFALREIALRDRKPSINISLVFVSDEETDSTYGIKFLLEKGLFGKNDLIIVPDYGSSDGSFIEVAEKGILWIKFETSGQQTHASQPHLGINAHLMGMHFATNLHKSLKKKFNLTNELFNPPYSTFEPTKKEANLDNVNTIPGKDVIYFDCRVLPEYKLSDVIKYVKRKAQTFSKKEGVKINLSIIQKDDAPPITSPNSEIIKKLKEAITTTLKIETKMGGIGGGTCAAILRNAGLDVAVWAKLDHTAHQVNEYSNVSYILDEVKVFHHLMMNL